MSAEEEQKHDDDPVAEEDGTGVVIENPSTSKMGTSNHRSTHSQGMESSVLRFKNVNFVVGKKDKQKSILTDVSGTVKWGHVLAIMGPSGAGKTTLVSALTLEGLYGEATGKVTLNGVPLTDKIFKSHCYVVKQHDKHWPYLTCRETLMFAAELYDVAVNRAEMALVVDEILDKMGLKVCENTRNGSLSGGQRRRLSIGIALLKQPTMLFLDEPTSGLDAASASNIMREIVRVAKEERLIIICTIHQPSTKVYQGFDELMLMSRGREAFSGDVNEAIPYFESIGHPCPPATNPAEFLLVLDESIVTMAPTILAVVAALVASASAFAPAKTAFTSSALFNQKADWGKAAELGWSMGGEDYTRNVTPQKNEDPRKNIEEGPSFEEYMKQRQQQQGQGY